MNKIILIGNLTKDIEIKQAKSGKKFATFSIAVDRGEKDADDNNITDFFDVIAGEKIADALAAYGKKGKKIGVVGTMTRKTLTERESGNKRTFYTVRGESFDFLTPREKSAEKTPYEEYDDADIPF